MGTRQRSLRTMNETRPCLLELHTAPRSTPARRAGACWDRARCTRALWRALKRRGSWSRRACSLLRATLRPYRRAARRARLAAALRRPGLGGAAAAAHAGGAAAAAAAAAAGEERAGARAGAEAGVAGAAAARRALPLRRLPPRLRRRLFCRRFCSTSAPQRRALRSLRRSPTPQAAGRRCAARRTHASRAEHSGVLSFAPPPAAAGVVSRG